MKEDLKKLRRKLDGFSQVVERLKPLRSIGISADMKDYMDDKKQLFELTGHREYINSPQIENCHVSLLLAKAWTGKLLGSLGEDTPYKNDGQRQDIKDIEPTNDKVDIKAWEERNNWSELNLIQKVDYLREQIKELQSVVGTFNLDTLEQAIYRTNLFNHLVEARFYLGFELERIKQNVPDRDIETFLYGGITKK